MINYYRDLWPRRSELSTPLTKLTGGSKKGFVIQEWNDGCENAFIALKKLIAQETLLAYPHFNKKFTIHTDASDFQLGAVIS